MKKNPRPMDQVKRDAAAMQPSGEKPHSIEGKEKKADGENGRKTAGKQSISVKRNERSEATKKRRKRKKAVRRRRRAMLGMVVIAVLLALVLIELRMNYAVIGWKIYPLSIQSVDLQGGGLKSVKEIARLTNLQEALLSDNQLTDVSSLKTLADCKFIDLTGNPVSVESYMELRDSLPSCLILCESEDYSTLEMALGGYPLPDLDDLIRVFESHKALQTVDLRGTDLSQEAVSALREHFPQIDFISSSAESVDALVIHADCAEEVAEMLTGVSGEECVVVTGCTLTPDEYRALKEQFQEMTLDCWVSVYGKTYLISETDMDLSDRQTDHALEENLSLFVDLQNLKIRDALPSEAASLKAALGLRELVYHYNGNEISSETTEIDLRSAAGLNAVELEKLLAATHRVTTVTMDVPDEQMMPVIDAYKERVHFDYELKAFGETFSSMSEAIDLGDAVTDEQMEELVSLLDRMPMLTEAFMYDSQISRENMDMLFERYPGVFFGWTFTMCGGEYVVRTDITAFSTLLGWPVHVYTQEDFAPLRYCKNLQALDLGHNAITDLDFLRHFPHLKLLILADNQITDITPIASLTELEYLELFMNEELEDYSPLQNLKLTDLNVRKGAELNVEQFLGMTTLKRFWATNDQFDRSDVERLREALPECEVSVTSSHSTGNGWRETDIYKAILRMFDSREYEPFR